MAKFLQVFLATDNSLCQLFHGSAVNQSNDIHHHHHHHTFSVNIMFVLHVSLRTEYMMCSLQSSN